MPRLRSHVNGTITDSTVVAVHSFPATGELETALVFQPMRCLRDRRVPNCHGDCKHADQCCSFSSFVKLPHLRSPTEDLAKSDREVENIQNPVMLFATVQNFAQKLNADAHTNVIVVQLFLVTANLETELVNFSAILHMFYSKFTILHISIGGLGEIITTLYCWMRSTWGLNRALVGEHTVHMMGQPVDGLLGGYWSNVNTFL